jgi:hypothetical protein
MIGTVLHASCMGRPLTGGLPAGQGRGCARVYRLRGQSSSQRGASHRRTVSMAQPATPRGAEVHKKRIASDTAESHRRRVDEAK